MDEESFENRTYVGQRWSESNSRLFYVWRHDDIENLPEYFYKTLTPKYASLGTTFRFTLTAGNKFYTSGDKGPVRIGRVEDQDLLDKWAANDRAAKTKSNWMSMSRKEGDQFKDSLQKLKEQYWSYSDRRLRTAFLANVIYDITVG